MMIIPSPGFSGEFDLGYGFSSCLLHRQIRIERFDINIWLVSAGLMHSVDSVISVAPR